MSADPFDFTDLPDYDEALLRKVAEAISDAEAGHLDWDTQARAALDAAGFKTLLAEREKLRAEQRADVARDIEGGKV